MPSKLELYDLPHDKQLLLEQIFSEHSLPHPILEIHKRRPAPSILRRRVMQDLSIIGLSGNRHPPAVMAAVLSSVQRSWDSYADGSVAPNEFMRTPFGTPYEIVSIEGKGRGVIASRDIKANEVILQDSPVIVLPPGDCNIATFLALPQKALEALLLLHNTKPEYKRFSSIEDIPLHRLLDLLQGVMDTNSFGGTGSYGSVGVILLAGSMFNHSSTPNLTRRWDDRSERMVFVSVRGIKKGEELEIDYVPNMVGVERTERLKNYGL
jgi:hypothetical protein